jgi:hypothetical protein
LRYVIVPTPLWELFEEIELPGLSHIHFDLINHTRKTVYEPVCDTSQHLIRILDQNSIQAQNLSITVNNELNRSSNQALCHFEPFDPREGSLQRLEHLHTMCVPSVALVMHAVHHNDESEAEVLTLGDLPPNLKHLKILYPAAPTLNWLSKFFARVAPGELKLQTLTLLCDWRWGKHPAWFERRRDLLDDLPLKVIIAVAPGDKMPEGFVDSEVSGLLDVQTEEEDLLAGLFGAD